MNAFVLKFSPWLLIFTILTACRPSPEADAGQTPVLSFSLTATDTPVPTAINSPLPLPTSTFSPPPIDTPQPTPSPSAAAIEPGVPTHFPNSLKAFLLVYNPAASLELPPVGSISMLFWGREIPVMPVDSTPEFIPYPTPRGMEGSADPLIGFGCDLDYWGWAICPPDNPLQRFGCDHLVDPRGLLAHGLDTDISLVAICLKKTEEHEVANTNGLYLTGCAFRTENHYIFETGGQYFLVSSIDELKGLFAPIDSPQEAVSYAQLVTGLHATYSFDYDPTLMYFHESITATHTIQTGDAFKINLFNMSACSCEPWFNTQITIRVDRTGQVTWLDAIPIFMTTGWSCVD